MKNKKHLLLLPPLLILMLAVVIFAPLLWGKRALNEQELQIAQNIFGKALPYEDIRLKEGSPLTWVYPAVTIGNTIAFPKGEYDPESSKVQALLMHELTHVWQYQTMGWTYAPKALHEEIFQKDAYTVHYDPEKSFTEYDIEEQAEIVAEYFLTGEEKYEDYIHFINGTQQYELKGEPIEVLKEWGEAGFVDLDESLFPKPWGLTLNSMNYELYASNGQKIPLLLDLEHIESSFKGSNSFGEGRGLSYKGDWLTIHYKEGYLGAFNLINGEFRLDPIDTAFESAIFNGYEYFIVNPVSQHPKISSEDEFVDCQALEETVSSIEEQCAVWRYNPQNQSWNVLHPEDPVLNEVYDSDFEMLDREHVVFYSRFWECWRICFPETYIYKLEGDGSSRLLSYYEFDWHSNTFSISIYKPSGTQEYELTLQKEDQFYDDLTPEETDETLKEEFEASYQDIREDNEYFIEHLFDPDKKHKTLSEIEAEFIELGCFSRPHLQEVRCITAD